MLFASQGFAQKQSRFVADALSKWMDNYTLAVVETMQEGKYKFKPVLDENTFGYQLINMTTNMFGISAKLIINTNPMLELKPYKDRYKNIAISKKEIIEHLRNAFDYVEENFAQMTNKTLEVDLDYWGEHSTKRKIVSLLNDHHIYQRGQLIMYLRLNDIVPPKYIG